MEKKAKIAPKKKAKIAPKAKAKAKVQVEKQDTNFDIVLKINGVTYEANASEETLADTILELKPIFYKTRLILTVTKGSQKVERTFFGLNARRIFNNKITMASLTKNITAGLR